MVIFFFNILAQDMLEKNLAHELLERNILTHEILEKNILATMFQCYCCVSACVCVWVCSVLALQTVCCVRRTLAACWMHCLLHYRTTPLIAVVTSVLGEQRG